MFDLFLPTGTVSGPVVYVNYDRVEDYVKLKEMGINVTGTIAVARNGKIYRGDTIENAYVAGPVGAVIYTDRKDYGSGGNNKELFPDNKGMPSTGVQVGTVCNGAGDPMTPGWASTNGCERLSDDDVADSDDIPHIPSLPVSWADGERILGAIGGHMADDNWQGGFDGSVYKFGPGPGVLELSYEGMNVISTIQNVIGVIEGREEPDRYVILGNHRDAWTFTAVDPNSGTAALLEIGSTEWVEENRELMSSKVVAYLNVDCGVSGPSFYSSATPQLDGLIKQSAQMVQDPDNATQTIYDLWLGSSANPTIGRQGGAGSDYSAFVQHIGVSSADIR